MPPRSGLTSSFSVTDANNEVVCPLKNHDGSSCRKRCIGVSVAPTAGLSCPGHDGLSVDAEMETKMLTSDCYL
jgi:hypothetical protein